MAFRHGVYVSEVPTSIVPPVNVDSAMPVVFGTAPIHLAQNPYGATNKPFLCHTNAQAVTRLGFNMKPEIWDNYTLPQSIFSQFGLFAVSPVVYVNVLDPTIHIEKITGYVLPLVDGMGTLKVDGMLLDTVSIDNYEPHVDYTLSFDIEGFVIVHVEDDSSIDPNGTLEVNYTKLRPDLVDIYDIIGGFNAQTKKNEGLELMNEIFPLFRLVPGQLLAPRFSGNPVVAAVMNTRAENINGHFRCISLHDLPTMIDGEHHYYTDIPAYKNQNNFVFTGQYNLYPSLKLGDQIYDYSAQMAGLIGRTDFENGGTSHVSPSNKNLRINGICYEDGEEIVLNTDQANYLNGQGVTTAINFTRGWVGWGNRTGAFPGNTDVKDNMLPIRRMFYWIGNTIILTYWNKVDFPLRRRLIDTVVDSVGVWLNGLKTREIILGGRIEFIEDDNPRTDLLDGTIRFRLLIAPPGPAEEIEFILEYDPEYLATLFG